jgi:hypothetical protein
MDTIDQIAAAMGPTGAEISVAERAGVAAAEEIADVTSKAIKDSEAIGAVTQGSRALTTYYPAANGFLGATSQGMLSVGTTVDRYGGTPLSRFFSPAGTPLAARSLPPDIAMQSLRSFKVVKPFTVETGRVAPAFGQIGLGIQYRSTLTLDELLQQGFLQEVGP